MSADFKQERELFGIVVALPKAEREPYLAANAPSEQMRNRILDLLAASEREDDILDRPPASLFDPTATPANQDPCDSLGRLAVGTTLVDRYSIVRYLAGGSFGSVYEALDTRVSKSVVVKVLQEDGDWVRRHFDLERESIARLRHPGIVGVSDCGVTPGGRPFLVLDFIEGYTLETELRTIGAMQVHRAAELISALGDALQHAHDRDVIHRDLKPANIMLSMPGRAEERPVIIDFGIAKLKRPTEEAASTTAITGTQHYWAPEQALGGRIGTSVDVFAFGLITFEILTGQRFRKLEPGFTEDEAIVRRLLEFAPQIDPGTAKLLSKFCANQAAQRPPNIRDAARELSLLLTSPAQEAPLPLNSPSRFNRRAMLVVALGSCGAAGVGWFSIRSAATRIEFTLQRQTQEGWVAQGETPISPAAKLRISLRPIGKAVHFYILSPVNDKLYVLFPTSKDPTSRLMETTIIPDEKGFELDAKDGSIDVWAAVSQRPIPALEEAVVNSVRQQRDEVQDSQRIRELWQVAPMGSAHKSVLEATIEPTFMRFVWKIQPQ